jgi:nitrate/nitrite-specific signal transduction histidine kinase
MDNLYEFESRIPEDQNLHLFKLAQESMKNILTHMVDFSTKLPKIPVEVVDDARKGCIQTPYT